MKNLVGLMMVAVAAMMMGCDKPSETTGSGPAKTVDPAPVTKVALENDLCGKCGCCAGCEECCKGEKCEKCGMQAGTALCCAGVEPADVVYCKACGFAKGTENCCAESNETCKCGMAKGSPLCCKLKSEEAGHDHDDENADHNDDNEGN